VRTLRDSLLTQLATRLTEEGEPEAEASRTWAPFPGPQTDAYESPADMLFYGGAAGGGKTDLVIGLALTAHQQSIIYRREYPQLKGILRRTEELLGSRRGYNGQDKVWRLPGGRVLELGAVQYLHDREKYQGRPHDLKAFDEITQFLFDQFIFLIAWNRTSWPGQRTRVVCTGNPPVSAEGMWVVNFWGPWLDDQHPKPALPGQLRWFAMLPDDHGRWTDVEVEDGRPFEHRGEEIRPLSRTFIPARIEDNPVYMATGYKATLQALPEPLRSQLLHGDFAAGGEDDPWQVIPTSWVKAAFERWRALEARRQIPGPMSCLGMDVARGGKDKTVLARRHGTWFAPLLKHPGTSTPSGQRSAALAVAALRDRAHVNIDILNVGGSPYDHLRENRVPVVGVNFGQKTLRGDGQPHTDKTGKLVMRNVRAFAYWHFREALDPETGADLALPPDQELLGDLTAPHWEITAGGVKVEDKEEIIRRLGRSPDCGDAIVLAHLPTAPPVINVAVSGSRTWAGASADL
jgi:hypothetical protein